MSQLLCLVIILMWCNEYLQNNCSSVYLNKFSSLWSQTLSQGILLGRDLKTNPSWGAINQNGLPFVSIADGPIAPIKRRGGERRERVRSRREWEKRREGWGHLFLFGCHIWPFCRSAALPLSHSGLKLMMANKDSSPLSYLQLPLLHFFPSELIFSVTLNEIFGME